MTLAALVLAPAVALGATADVLSRVPIGTSSFLGALTVTLAAMVMLILPATILPQHADSRVPILLLAFLIWSAARFLVGDVTVEGAQNMSVYFCFIAAACIMSSSLNRYSPATVARAFVLGGWVLAGGYTLGVLREGVNANSVFGARSFALATIIPLAVVFGHWQTEQRRLFRWLPFVLIPLVAVSLSRTALAAVLIMGAVAIALGARRRFGVWPRLGIGLAVLGCCGWLVVSNYAPLQDRFASGDVRAYGGLQINTTGRDYLWRIVLQDARSEPIAGHGLGTASRLLQKSSPINQPHNDYLRLYHDVGLVGLGLFVAGAIRVLQQLLHGARAASGQAGALRRSAGLALAGVLMTAITDNTLIYIFVVLPLGVLVGTGLRDGIRAQLQAGRLPRDRRFVDRQ